MTPLPYPSPTIGYGPTITTGPTPPSPLLPPPWVRVVSDGVIIQATIVAGARRHGIADRSGDRLRIRVAAPPVEGRANEELRTFLAAITSRRRSQVTVLSGATSRTKSIHVHGEPSAILDALMTDATPPSRGRRRGLR